MYELSICIPAYNREKYLRTALDSIIGQLDADTKERVEICVSDNASEDNTKELIESYMQKHRQITYFRWDKNMGADNNYLKVVEIAGGKYCWFLGSDDILMPGSINRMLREIELGGGIDIFCVNSLTHDINLKNPSTAKHSMRKKNGDIIFNDYRECIKKMGELFGYISIFIFKKEKWDKFAAEKKYIGSAYSHVYIFYSILKDKGILKYIIKPLIGYRGGNDSFLLEGSLKRITIDIKGYNEIASDVFGKNSSEVKNLDKIVLKQNVFGWIMVTILTGNASLKYRFKVLALTFEYYRGYASYWLRVFPLLIMPTFVMKSARFFYRLTIKRFRKNI